MCRKYATRLTTDGGDIVLLHDAVRQYTRGESRITSTFHFLFLLISNNKVECDMLLYVVLTLPSNLLSSVEIALRITICLNGRIMGLLLQQVL